MEHQRTASGAGQASAVSRSVGTPLPPFLALVPWLHSGLALGSRAGRHAGIALHECLFEGWQRRIRASCWSPSRGTGRCWRRGELAGTAAG